MKADEIASTVWEALAKAAKIKPSSIDNKPVNPLMAAIQGAKSSGGGAPDTTTDPLISALEAGFCDPSVLKNKAGVKKAPKKKKVEKVLLLDAKRNQAVSIGLGRIKLAHDQVRKALISLDEKQLTDLADAGGVQKWLGLVPTEEEYNKVMDYCSGNGGIEFCVTEKLGPVECFFATVGNVPRLVQRLQAVLEMLTFEELLGDVLKNMHFVQEAERQLRAATAIDSKPGVLREFYTTALKIGNRMNLGNKARGDAVGFRPDTLPKLATVKYSSDPKKGTLINFIVEFIGATRADALVTQELSAIKNAVTVNLEQIDGDFARLDDAIKTNVEDELDKGSGTLADQFAKPFIAKIRPFALEARRRLKVCKEDLKKTRASVESVAELYGGQAKEGDSCPVQAFFTIWNNFVNDVDAARIHNKKLADKAAKEAQKKAAAEKKAKKKKEKEEKERQRKLAAQQEQQQQEQEENGGASSGAEAKKPPENNLFDHFAEQHDASPEEIAKKMMTRQ
uniref:FH2 domain-containing protein n=1 Tax=Aureoumbra lagunensis TaxID=44058 RepID=A0A7S3JTB7_9STRA